jgi:hypothetical protein
MTIQCIRTIRQSTGGKSVKVVCKFLCVNNVSSSITIYDAISDSWCHSNIPVLILTFQRAVPRRNPADASEHTPDIHPGPSPHLGAAAVCTPPADSLTLHSAAHLGNSEKWESTQ